MWPWNLVDDLKNNKVPLLYYIKLCASFQNCRWIQTEVTVRQISIRDKIGDFLPRVTLKFDGWSWKTIGHLFYTMSSLVHHFKAMCWISNCSYSPEKLNSDQNRRFLSRVTLKFDEWPWNTIGHLFYTTSSFVHHFKAIGEFKLELRFGNAQFTSKSAIFCPM